jgi:hypothetical protein
MGGCGQREASASASAHEYVTCEDPDCPRFICRVYKEGFENGVGAGFSAGQAAGYVEGYADGAAETAEA